MPEPALPHIEVHIDGRDYKATYVCESEILYVVINGKSYTCAATADTAEATVRAMMIEEALKDQMQKRHA